MHRNAQPTRAVDGVSVLPLGPLGGRGDIHQLAVTATRLPVVMDKRVAADRSVTLCWNGLL